MNDVILSSKNALLSLVLNMFFNIIYFIFVWGGRTHTCAYCSMLVEVRKQLEGIRFLSTLGPEY